MKKYRLKIPFYDRSIQYGIGDLFTLDYDCYKADESTKCLNKDFVEHNPDIFELLPEEKEEVIEGYVRYKAIDNTRYVHSHINFSEKQTEKNTIPATLIINPKKREEYVRWVTTGGLKAIKEPLDYCHIGLQKIFSPDFHKIKITICDD